MIDFTKYLTAGDGVWWGQAAAEPRPLVDALITQSPADRPDPHVHRAELERPARGHHARSNVDGVLRRARRTARAEPVRTPRSRSVPLLGAAAGCSPSAGCPATSDWCRCRAPTRTDCARWAWGWTTSETRIPHTPVLIAEINAQMPTTHGAPRIPLERFAATIATDRPLPEDSVRRPGAKERVIATHIAELVDDGDTVQLGVGSLGAAVLDALAEHQDLGFHTGMVDRRPTAPDRQGRGHEPRREIDSGFTVAGTALGSAELYHRAGRTCRCEVPADQLYP